MFNETRHIPDGASDFKAPDTSHKEKKPGFFSRIFRNKTTRAVTLGAAAIAAGPESANADWAEKMERVGSQVEKGGRIYEVVTDAGTRREQVKGQNKNEDTRIAAEKEARLEEIKARKEIDMAREKTIRQERAGDVAIQTGKDEFSTKTTDDETTFTSKKQGSTPQERIAVNENLSAEERLKIERKMQQDRIKAEQLIRQQQNPMYKNIKVPIEEIK